MSLSPKQANNERLRALCQDSARQAALAKRNPRRTAWNGHSRALQSSSSFTPAKERT